MPEPAIVRQRRHRADWFDLASYNPDRFAIVQRDHKWDTPGDGFALVSVDVPGEEDLRDRDVEMIGGRLWIGMGIDRPEFTGFVQGERGAFEDWDSPWHLERWKVVPDG